MNLKLAFILFAACALSHAQAVPDATAPNGLPVVNNMHYSMRYSQTAYIYGNQNAAQGDQSTGIASADMDYTHPNERFPLTLSYGGGYMWPVFGASMGTGVFQHLSLSQGLVQRQWNLTGSEDVNYTPQTPTTGFSGIPGTGEPIGEPGANPPSQTVLTLNTRTLSNSATLQAGYRLNYATTLNLGGGSQLLRFPDGDGLATDGLQGNAGITRRIDGRSSLAAQYMFSHYSYGASQYSGGVAGSFDTNAISVDYTHSWSRNLKTDTLVGPQWVTASAGSTVPPTQTVMVKTNANYQFRAEEAFVNYNRGVSGGTGYLPAATVDTVTGGLSRNFARTLNLGVTGSYYRTAALAGVSGVSVARFGGVQATKQMGPFLSFFANYTAVDQSSGLASQTNVLNQLYQLVSFGIAYSPRESRRRR